MVPPQLEDEASGGADERPSAKPPSSCQGGVIKFPPRRTSLPGSVALAIRRRFASPMKCEQGATGSGGGGEHVRRVSTRRAREPASAGAGEPSRHESGGGPERGRRAR